MSVGGKMASIAELFNGGTRWTVETGCVEELFEDEDGHFATILMGAEEEEITVARAMLYVGDEYGLFLPLEKGQNVPVFIPANDPNLSPFTFGVIGANVHKVPADVLDNPDDFWLIMKPGRNIRLIVSDGGQVMLGGNTARALLGDAVYNWLISHTHKETGGETAVPSQTLSSSDALSDTVVLG